MWSRHTKTSAPFRISDHLAAPQGTETLGSSWQPAQSGQTAGDKKVFNGQPVPQPSGWDLTRK